MANPARLLLHFLLTQAIKERVTRLSYRLGADGGTLRATSADEFFEVIPPPVNVVPSLFSQLARLASIDDYSSEASGTFQLVNTTLLSIGSWNGDRPITVDVTLSADRFDLELTYSDTPVDPIEVTLEIPPT